MLNKGYGSTGQRIGSDKRIPGIDYSLYFQPFFSKKNLPKEHRSPDLMLLPVQLVIGTGLHSLGKGGKEDRIFFTQLYLYIYECFL